MARAPPSPQTSRAMADLFRGHERRFSDAGACFHPAAELLIGRLDELDTRLRQLEEKQSVPESYFTADLRRAAARNAHHHQCRSMPLALHDVRLKGTLMDRLQLLETRIHQLSFELDKGGSNAASSSTTRQTKENGSAESAALLEKNKKQGNALSSSRVAGAPWRAGDLFHKSKTKDTKEVTDAMEKRMTAVCRNEKRKMERTRVYRRWFPVGC